MLIMFNLFFKESSVCLRHTPIWNLAFKLLVLERIKEIFLYMLPLDSIYIASTA
jgi:hypothetical protein